MNPHLSPPDELVELFSATDAVEAACRARGRTRAPRWEIDRAVNDTANDYDAVLDAETQKWIADAACARTHSTLDALHRRHDDLYHAALAGDLYAQYEMADVERQIVDLKALLPDQQETAAWWSKQVEIVVSALDNPDPEEFGVPILARQLAVGPATAQAHGGRHRRTSCSATTRTRGSRRSSRGDPDDLTGPPAHSRLLIGGRR